MGILSAVLIAAAVSLWLTSSSKHRLNSIVGGSASGRTRRKSRSVAEQHGSIAGQAAVVADLLGTAVVAGATVNEAVAVVIEAVDEPMSSRLRSVLAALEMGADPHSAWSAWLDVPVLSPIAQAIIRSQHSGSPLSVVLDAAATDMRHTYRAEVEARARAAGVRAVAPLALCYLPAYLLVGVVPVVAGFATSLFG